MKKVFVVAMMLAAVSMSVNAAKKEKQEVAEPQFGVKSGVMTISNDRSAFGGGAGMGMGGFGGGAGMGGQRPQGAPGGQGFQGGQGGQRPQGGFQGGQGGQRPQGEGQDGQRARRQMNFDPSQMVTKIYFDDWGRKSVTVTSRGEAGTTRSLMIDGENYNINDAEKSATKMPQFGRRGGQGGGQRGGGAGMGMGGFGGGMMGMGGATTPMFDWDNLDAKTIKKNKIKELGEEEIAGVKCRKYSVTTSSQGYKTVQTLWIYKNITMKSESETDWGTMSQSIEKLEEVDVDPALFELPADYKVEEMQMNFGGGAGMGGMGGGGFGGGMPQGGFGGGAGAGGFGGGFGGGF